MVPLWYNTSALKSILDQFCDISVHILDHEGQFGPNLAQKGSGLMPWATFNPLGKEPEPRCVQVCHFMSDEVWQSLNLRW